MFLFMGFAVEQTDNKATNTGITYTCSMHPEITSDKPGTCPKCGMDLIQKETVQYTCPMHPEVISNSPGKCPKCGMKLQKPKDQNHKMKMGCCM